LPLKILAQVHQTLRHDNLLKFAFRIRSYPFVNSICIVPLAIVYWSKPFSEVAFFLAEANYQLTGLYNVLLFLYTRRGLLLFTPASPTQGDGLDLRLRADMTMGRLIAPVEGGRDLPRPARVHERGLRV
jgi:hypothetical protein